MPEDPKSDHDPPLAYQLRPDRPVTRRQHRILLALVVLNLLISIQYAYAPGVSTFIKEQWAEHKRRAAQAAAVKQAAALERQAMQWTEPQTKVVWDEDPETAAKLLAGTGYKKVAVGGLDAYAFLARWPRAAAVKSPPFVYQLFKPFPVGLRSVPRPDEHALILLHGLRSPSGQERLLYVFVEGSMNLTYSARMPDQVRRQSYSPSTKAPDAAFSATVLKSTALYAVPCQPGGGESPPKPLTDDAIYLYLGRWGQPDGPGVKWSWTPLSPEQQKEAVQPGLIRIEGPGLFRFYAGQADPADAAHFTIGYDLDGRHGTIHGRLKDNGSVEFKPDTGAVLNDRWYPSGQ
jgi:hypothetical protein